MNQSARSSADKPLSSPCRSRPNFEEISLGTRQASANDSAALFGRVPGLALSVLSVPGSEPVPTDRHTDEALVARGDAGSFAMLYERHVESVYRYIAGRLATLQEAEDVTSEVFRRAWSNRHSYGGRGTVRAWIFAIAHRTLADHYRRHRPASALDTVVFHEMVDEQASPEESIIRTESTKAVRRLLEQLSPVQQEI